MPQASPMNWMIMSTTLSMITTSSFSIKNKNIQSIKTSISTEIKSKNKSWKW